MICDPTWWNAGPGELRSDRYDDEEYQAIWPPGPPISFEQALADLQSTLAEIEARFAADQCKDLVLVAEPGFEGDDPGEILVLGEWDL